METQKEGCFIGCDRACGTGTHLFFVEKVFPAAAESALKFHRKFSTRKNTQNNEIKKDSKR